MPESFEYNIAAVDPSPPAESTSRETTGPETGATPRLTRSEQSRINGAKSRGPTSTRGKAICSLNALKHGAYAKVTTPICVEDAAAYPAYLKQYVDRLKPADGLEFQLVTEIASIDWRLNRSHALESRAIDVQYRLDLATDPVEEFELTRLAVGYRKLVDHSKLPEFLIRQQESLVRTRRATYETLFRLRAGQPRGEQTQIPNIANDIDPETDLPIDPAGIETDPPDPGNRPENRPDSGLPDSPSQDLAA